MCTITYTHIHHTFIRIYYTLYTRIYTYVHRYTFRKWLETLIKSIIHKYHTISCVPPNYYANRMYDFFDQLVV